MRSNRSCIIRCTLDNMFRNSKQFSGSPPLYDSGHFKPSDIPTFSLGGAAPPLAASNDDSGLPICRQFMDIDVDARYTLDSAQDVPLHITGRGSKSNIDVQSPNVSMHTQCTPLQHTDLEMCTHAPPSKEIREYDFLRCMEEGPRPVLAHEDVDCTLHLGTVPSETADCGAAALKKIGRLSTSMLDMRASSKHLVRDSISLPSFGRATQSMAIPDFELANTHPNLAPKKEYNISSLPWDSSGSSIIRRTEVGAGVSTLLRENTHDIEECASSSRTSSNSSGNTLKASAASESSIMHNYSRPRERENFLGSLPSASFGPKQWFQCRDHGSSAGALANTKAAAGRLHGNDSYRTLAGASLSAQGGPFTPQVLSGASSKEASNYVIRMCAQCKTMRTPLWRNGPQGPKSLCNACGIRYKKEERRSAAVDQLQEADQRPRSSSMDAGDRRPIAQAEFDQLSRFNHDNRRPRFIPDTLDDRMSNKEHISDDQRPRLVDMADEPSRFLAAREKRPKLVNDYNRCS